LANVAALEKNEDQRAAWLIKAVETAPRNAASRLRLIAFYSDTGKNDKALATARDFAVNAPNDPQALEILGKTELANNNPERAVDAFERLTGATTNSAGAFTLLASAQVLSKDVSAARKSLQKAIELDSAYVPAHAALVELEIRDQKLEAALKAADDLKKINPNIAAGDLLRGDVLAQQKRYDDAVKSYETALKLDNSPVLAIRRYAAQRAGGKTDVAYQTLEKWVADNNNAVARNALASAYLSDKNFAKAIEHTERLLETNQNNPVLLNNLAWSYQQTGDKRAKEVAEKALAAAPNSPAIMDTLGWILVESDDAQRGFDLLKKAVEAAPNQGDIRYHMAAALQRQGRKEDARRELEKLLADNADMVNFTLKSDAEKLLKQLTGG
jgi:putative PEP-CTERM system TPR-repeat lipoprotein